MPQPTSPVPQHNISVYQVDTVWRVDVSANTLSGGFVPWCAAGMFHQLRDAFQLVDSIKSVGRYGILITTNLPVYFTDCNSHTTLIESTADMLNAILTFA